MPGKLPAGPALTGVPLTLCMQSTCDLCSQGTLTSPTCPASGDNPQPLEWKATCLRDPGPSWIRLLQVGH